MVLMGGKREIEREITGLLAKRALADVIATGRRAGNNLQRISLSFLASAALPVLQMQRPLTAYATGTRSSTRLLRDDTSLDEWPAKLLIRPTKDLSIFPVIAQKRSVHTRLLVKCINGIHFLLGESDRLYNWN